MTRWSNAMLAFAVFATLFPPPVEYFAVFLVFLWLVRDWRQKQQFAYATLAPEVTADLRWILLGAGVFVLTSALSSILAASFGSYQLPLTTALAPYVHLLFKRAAVWFFLGLGVARGYQRGWRFAHISRLLIVLLTLHLAYGLLQRETGIDWVHGLHAVLPQHRVTVQGIYRVSAFMGHPISLSYNLMAVVILVVAQLIRHGERLTPNNRRAALLVLALLGINLLISGSRWPFAAIGLSLVFCEGRRLWRWRKPLAVASLMMVAALWVEGTLVQRGKELFTVQTESMYERIPRLLFWRVHLEMFRDHPLVGVGYSASETAALDYYAADGFANFREKFPAHNIFLQTLADGGLVGFAGVVFLLATFFMVAKRLERRGHCQGLSLLAVATIIGGLMQNLLRDATYLYAMWLCLAVLLAEAELTEPRRAALEPG